MQSAFDTLAEGVVVLDEKDTILLANDAFTRLMDARPGTLIGADPGNFGWQRPDQGENGDLPWRSAVTSQQPVRARRLALPDKAGQLRSYMVNASCIQDSGGHVSGTIATFDDVTQVEQQNDNLTRAVAKLKESEAVISKRNEELEYIASHDGLSGCLNRRAFFDRFEKTLEQATLAGTPLSCVMVDLDHFKSVNDRYGHAVGDQVISGAAGVLKAACGDHDFVGRYGGEEFCAVFVGQDDAQSRQTAERIRLKIAEQSPAWFPSKDRATTSIGLAMRANSYDEGATATLVDQADKALYAAKEGGRNQVIAWSDIRDQVASLEASGQKLDTGRSAGDTDRPNTRVHAPADRAGPPPALAPVAAQPDARIVEGIDHALANGGFMLAYQPIIDAQSGRLSALEALLRINDPVLGAMPISTVIDAAEETGQIVPIGEWVMRAATAQFNAWRSEGLALPRISVNVSTLQLNDSASIERLAQVITESGMAGNKLQVEVTETTALDDLDFAAQALDSIRALGVRVALDDFGAGYSSLRYMKSFKPHVVKIDRGYVQGIIDDEADRHFLAAMITMARATGVKVVVEGIENQQQMTCVRAMGCDEVQGFGIAQPMPAAITTQWLQLFARGESANSPIPVKDAPHAAPDGLFPATAQSAGFAQAGAA